MFVCEGGGGDIHGVICNSVEHVINLWVFFADLFLWARTIWRKSETQTKTDENYLIEKYVAFLCTNISNALSLSLSLSIYLSIVQPIVQSIYLSHSISRISEGRCRLPQDILSMKVLPFLSSTVVLL